MPAKIQNRKLADGMGLERTNKRTNEQTRLRAVNSTKILRGHSRHQQTLCLTMVYWTRHRVHAVKYEVFFFRKSRSRIICVLRGVLDATSRSPRILRFQLHNGAKMEPMGGPGGGLVFRCLSDPPFWKLFENKGGQMGVKCEPNWRQLRTKWYSESGPNLESISGCNLDGSPWPFCWCYYSKTNKFDGAKMSENWWKREQNGIQCGANSVQNPDQMRASL